MGDTVSRATLKTRRPKALQRCCHMPVGVCFFVVLFCFLKVYGVLSVYAPHVCSSHKGQKGALDVLKPVLAAMETWELGNGSQCS